LGGSVHIETRAGLDFAKPFALFTYDQQMDSTTQRWTPEYSTVLASNFMHGRLGIIANADYSEYETTSDIEQPQTSGLAGPSRNADFDQSPNKTFTYNPGIVDPTANAGNFRVLGPGGTATYSSLSPIDILAKSAAAASPQAC